MATFNWTHDYGAELDVEPRTLSATFGDGYTQEAEDGINAKPRKWSLSFANRSYAEAEAIGDFLAENYLAFDWTDPDGRPGRWKAASWRSGHPRARVKTITVTFEEVFGR